ncbi:MAG TPA: ATP-binding protein [Solirubrobacteraceae bacterium]|nr:ATP-binding protein [Solirubrobacteraceae bacterium]
MRPPITLVHGNCVCGPGGLRDGWAAFAVPTVSYRYLSDEAKRARMRALQSALQAVAADVQIVRVERAWDVAAYEREVGGSHALCRRYVGEHTRRLHELRARQVELFLFVSLREPERDVSAYVSRAAERHPREWLDGLRRSLAPRDRRLLHAAELERMQALAEQARARLSGHLRARPASSAELQWLVRRAFCRGLDAEPQVDALHEPRALLFGQKGHAVFAPLEGDVLRWMDGWVEQRGRLLRIESELGVSWQALLVLGALPETAEFPGARVELMSSTVEALPFAVDLSLNARHLPNDLALRIARRRVQDADQILRAESDGEQGASEQGRQRTLQARELLAQLQSSSRPPLLRATLTLAVGAASEHELQDRVEMCRRAYGEVCLHRPLGDQLQLFCQHLPGQRTRVTGYDDTLTTEQVAAMMPTATHRAGSARGFYLGHTLSGSRRPLRLALREGSESDRNTAILSVGALGSGKTTLAQKLQYEGFLLGARIVDCDPKGDHRFHLLPEVAPHVQEIALRADPALRGVLDPLRIAPAQLRLQAAVSFLRDLLPARAEPAWETAVVGAVDTVLRRAARPSCLEVVAALRDGDETDREVAKTLAVYARSGLTQLGFADPELPPVPFGQRQVTYLPIRDLPSAQPGVPRSERSQAERVGEQLMRLIAMFAMQLMAAERARLKLFAIDEGWRLLQDPVGRALLLSLQRMGRSELAVPIISTQLVTDTLLGDRAGGESIENLLGATFVFGMRSDAEAARALQLLGLDPADRRLRQTLLELHAGRCLFRDHRGRVEAIQVEVVARELLRAFSTTPEPARPR